MENASKALLMAAEILIGLIILTIGVYLTINYTKIVNSYSLKMGDEQIQSFNKSYLKYEKRTDITSQEIISIINFTKEYNQTTENEIKVFLDGIDMTAARITNDDLVDIFKMDLGAILLNISDDTAIKTYYTCINVTKDLTSGKVKQITFSKNL